MATTALLVRLDAQHGQEQSLEGFLASSFPEIEARASTVASFALRYGRGEYALFDVFADEAARQEHLDVTLPALRERAGAWLSRPPLIDRIEVLADKLPTGKPRVSKALLLTFKAQVGHAERVADFLRDVRRFAMDEPKTTAWYAFHLDSFMAGHGEFGIFDVFPDNGGRFTHLVGHVPRELAKHSLSLLGSVPDIDFLNVLAAKLP